MSKPKTVEPQDGVTAHDTFTIERHFIVFAVAMPARCANRKPGRSWCGSWRRRTAPRCIRRRGISRCEERAKFAHHRFLIDHVELRNAPRKVGGPAAGKALGSETPAQR
jgi:hypothetical protein